MNREKWLKIADEVADELNLPEAIRLPTPDDVAAALAEPWMVEWLQTFSEEFRALVKASGGVEPYSVRPDEQEGDQLGRSYGEVWLASDRLQALEALLMGIMALTTPTSPGMPADGGPLIIMGVKGGAFEIVYEIWTTVPKAKRKGLKDPLATLIKGFLLRPEEVRPIVARTAAPTRTELCQRACSTDIRLRFPRSCALTTPATFCRFWDASIPTTGCLYLPNSWTKVTYLSPRCYWRMRPDLEGCNRAAAHGWTSGS